MKKTAIIPFTIKRSPIEKLLLVNFEKDPDKLYTGLELQFINGDPNGKGYRVIAYRIDGYVDVYDSESLTNLPDESFAVAGKGMAEHKRVTMKNTRFTYHEHKLTASFEFLDKLDRKIMVHIAEHTNNKSNPIDLLAPIGVSSISPDHFPVYFLYDFDFVRRKNTMIHISIDEQIRKPDLFPVPIPKDFLSRYFTRFSMDSQLFEFAPNGRWDLTLITLNDKNQAKLGPLTYSFTRIGTDNHLATISYHEKNNHLTTVFSPALPDLTHLIENNTYTGSLRISNTPAIGKISGHYSVKLTGSRVTLTITFDDGWIVNPTSLLTKFMLNRKSTFCTWPKSYEYRQVIDLEELIAMGKWTRK